MKGRTIFKLDFQIVSVKCLYWLDFSNVAGLEVRITTVGKNLEFSDDSTENLIHDGCIGPGIRHDKTS